MNPLQVSKNVNFEEVLEFPHETRFLKLPFENVLKVHGIEPIQPQVALINAINDPQYRFVVAALSRRTGKTFIANLIAHAVTLMPGSTVLVMAPNYSLAGISWDEQNKIIKKFGIEVSRNNAKDRVLELKNGSMIRIGSIAQADSVVGRSYDLILFDECALDKNGQEVFNVQLRPTLDKDQSKAIFISTPRGHNWFYEFYKRGWDDHEDWKNWVSILSNVEDNPRAKPNDVEDARRGMSKAEFEQEYYCSFNAMQGLIWDFNRKNVMEIIPDPRWEVIGGLDLGFRDFTAFCVLMTDGFNFFAVDEYYDNATVTRKHAEAIKKLCDKYDMDFVFIDHAAAQTKADFAYEYDISCMNANKSVLDGIGYVASIVDWDRLYVDPKCVHVLEALNNYRWDLRENKMKEDPVHDDFCHMADALRYAMYTYSPNMETVGGIAE